MTLFCLLDIIDYLDGLEEIGNTEKVKLYKAYNPTTKPRAKYWDTKKELFVCQTGTKQNLNPLVTQVSSM